MPHPFTSQQQAFVDAMLHSEGSILMEAVAGSGKTTTMVGGANALPESTSIIACAFNKRNADALDQVMPSHATCKTMNGLGHKAWGRMTGKRLALETSKTFQLVKRLELWDFADIMLASRIAKSAGYIPEGAMGGANARALHSEGEEFWPQCIDDHLIDTKGRDRAWMNAADDLVRASIKEAWQGSIDFDDQIYMTALWGAPMDVADVVIVDEVQDISPIQRVMIHRMAKRRLAGAGDRNQAIYGFRGASFSSMDEFSHEWNCTEMPLTVCFRCPQEVVREAQQLVPHIEWADDAPQGLVQHHEKWTIGDLRSGDVIICRNNKPAVSLAFALLRQGVHCTVLGRDIGKNLIRQVKKIADRLGTTDLLEWRKELDHWTANECGVARAKFNEGKVQNLEDRRDTLHIFAENCGGDGIEHLIAAIERLFSDSKAPITLSTIHKVKGLEFPRVFFLDRHLLPSKYANGGDQLQQEDNLVYVGITRALEELHYITSEGLQYAPSN